MFLQNIANCVAEIQKMTGIHQEEAEKLQREVLSGDMKACEKVTQMLYALSEKIERCIENAY